MSAPSISLSRREVCIDAQNVCITVLQEKGFFRNTRKRNNKWNLKHCYQKLVSINLASLCPWLKDHVCVLFERKKSQNLSFKSLNSSWTSVHAQGMTVGPLWSDFRPACTVQSQDKKSQKELINLISSESPVLAAWPTDQFRIIFKQSLEFVRHLVLWFGNIWRGGKRVQNGPVSDKKYACVLFL